MHFKRNAVIIFDYHRERLYKYMKCDDLLPSASDLTVWFWRLLTYFCRSLQASRATRRRQRTSRLSSKRRTRAPRRRSTATRLVLRTRTTSSSCSTPSPTSSLPTIFEAAVFTKPLDHRRRAKGAARLQFKDSRGAQGGERGRMRGRKGRGEGSREGTRPLQKMFYYFTSKWSILVLYLSWI